MSASHSLRRRARLRARGRAGAGRREAYVQLVAFVQLTVIGGLAFASGFLGLAALRALSWPVALVVLAGGGVLLAATLAGAWYWQKTDAWRAALERLHA